LFDSLIANECHVLREKDRDRDKERKRGGRGREKKMIITQFFMMQKYIQFDSS